MTTPDIVPGRILSREDFDTVIDVALGVRSSTKPNHYLVTTDDGREVEVYHAGRYYEVTQVFTRPERGE